MTSYEPIDGSPLKSNNNKDVGSIWVGLVVLTQSPIRPLETAGPWNHGVGCKIWKISQSLKLYLQDNLWIIYSVFGYPPKVGHEWSKQWDCRQGIKFSLDLDSHFKALHLVHVAYDHHPTKGRHIFSYELRPCKAAQTMVLD